MFLVRESTLVPPLKSFDLPMADGTPIHLEIAGPVDADRVFLLSHGFCGGRDENGLFSMASDRLAAKGHLVIRYDWRGIGDSGGSFAETGLATHTNDLRSIISWVKTTYSASRLTGIGFSLGATLFLQAGGFDDLVCWSPAISPKVDMYPRYDIPEIHSAIKNQGYFLKAKIKVGEQILMDLSRTDTLDRLKQYASKVHIIHGTKDTRIPSVLIERYAQQARVPLRSLEGASHSFRPRDEYLGQVIDHSLNC